MITDYLTDGVEGIAVPLGDATAMRAAIRRLADQPELAQQMGEAGRRTATTRLTNSGFADRTAAVLLPVA
ncbi:glycosyltransferase [Sphingomonas sp. CARO-RG-8B-R24-01]|uniref:glycosyltransferase n=1 Tax=Sphingomonas sp. CARO-RG-8B-R24-01 TaxID=2914831 RepID=UPI001F5AA272